MFKKFLFALKMYFILGKDSQTFLDAKWIKSLLKSTPKKYKKTVALNVLALSPHYFLYSEEMKTRKSFLISEYKRNLSSRQLLFKHVISKYISPQSVVMDYGCGPGFLARIVAQRTKKVYAIDISDGVLLCADTINHRDNINYLNVFKKQTDSIPDNSVDLIYSFAVLQHVSANLVDDIFSLFYKKLKENGKLLVQVQLQAQGWKTEKEWTDDHSVSGKLKYEYGLHAFSNTISFYEEKMEKNGLKFQSLIEMSNLLPDAFDDIYHQQLIAGKKESFVPTSNPQTIFA
jgi:cyclopropane fatty-acyl-phospholipid synthase-like methyltransferase